MCSVRRPATGTNSQHPIIPSDERPTDYRYHLRRLFARSPLTTSDLQPIDSPERIRTEVLPRKLPVRGAKAPNEGTAGDSNGDSDSLHTTHTQVPSILAVSTRKHAVRPKAGTDPRISGQDRIQSGQMRQHQRAPSTSGSYAFCAVSFLRTTPWASGSWRGGIASGAALV